MSSVIGIKNNEDMQLYFHLGLQVKEIHVISFIKFVSKKSNLIWWNFMRNLKIIVEKKWIKSM